jgi:hypothetical protein
VSPHHLAARRTAAATREDVRIHNHVPNRRSETGPDGPTLPVTVSLRLFSLLRRGSRPSTSLAKVDVEDSSSSRLPRDGAELERQPLGL